MRNDNSVRGDGLVVQRRRFTLGLLAGATAATATACSFGGERSDSRLREPQTDDDDANGDAHIVRVGGSKLRVIIEGTQPSLPTKAYLGWVRKSAQMIADYYGGTLPVPGLEITLKTSGRGSIGYGHHKSGRWITIHCGRRTKQSSIDNDWVMVHEMLHATFPDLTDRHRWMQEGLSTYLEKIVRVRAGDIDENDVWRKLSKSMDHGRPRSGDRGLDRTHTWGRTYWGGALFWMMVDLELRQATDNDKSLRDVLLYIASIGGNARQMWSTDRVVEAADEGTGTDVVSRLYASMARAPGDVDLDQLWLDLGIVLNPDRSVTLHDDAPLAAIRQGVCET